MNENQRYLLISNRKNISEDLMVGDVTSYLQSKFAINVDDLDLIKLELTSRLKSEKLISILLVKQTNHFAAFHDALKYSEYDHLANLIASGLSNTLGTDEDCLSEVSFENILRDGGVPKLPQVFVQRNACLRGVHNALIKLKDEEGWVVLHGMAGCGKTTLASSALHNEKFVLSCFPGGIYWINLGQINDLHLLMKMQNLCLLLDRENVYKSVPQNLEEARDRLRLLFLYQHPKSLLVLDDLWSNAKYFDVQVRTLVTTRNSVIADELNEALFKVKVSDSLTPDQSRQILSRWSGSDILDLPSEADGIIEECQGSPLAVSMIGALLKTHKNRWQYYLSQLKQKKTSKVKSKLSYQYPSLYEAMLVSVDDLESTLRLRYVTMAIFNESVWVPSLTLEIYWGIEEIEVGDLMQELIDRSLADVKATDGKCLYSLHGLQLGFLKEQCGGAEEMKRLHVLFVDRHLEHYKKDLSNAKDDYIHMFLMFHLLNAGCLEIALQLLQDFSWLGTNIAIVGPAHLIQDYALVLENVKSKEHENESVVGILQDFCHFFSIQSHLLSANTYSKGDIVQLAISQPTSEQVYELAKHCANSRKNDALYYDWINRPADISTGVLLTSSLHQEAVNCCCFAHSPHATLIASAGSDKLVKIWNCVTGSEMHSLLGHQGTVNWCEFSPDDEALASCSSDDTVKIWSTSSGQQIMSLHGHTDEVLCCMYSPNGKWLASASIDMTVRVWDAITGVLITVLEGHTDVVNCCCFSQNSNMLASCSNDQTLKIYYTESYELSCTCNTEIDFFTSCLFTRDNDTVITATQQYLLFFSVADGALMKSVRMSSDILQLALSATGNQLTLAHRNMTATVYNLVKGDVVNIFKGHSSWLSSVSFHPDEQRLVTSSGDGICKVWQLKQGRSEMRTSESVFDVRFLSESKLQIAMTTDQNTIKMVDESGCVTQSSEKFQHEVCMCRFSTDGDILLVAFTNGLIKMLHSNSLTVKYELAHHSAKINDIFSSDTDFCVIGSQDHLCSVWNLHSGGIVTVFRGHTNIITKCCLLSKKNFACSSSYDGSVKVWDASDGMEVFTCNHSNDSVITFALSPDESTLCSCSADSTCKVWSLNDATLKFTVADYSDVIRCADFSNDGSLIATGSDDNTLKIITISRGEVLFSCDSFSSWLVDVKFAGNKLMTVSKNIKWFTNQGQPLQTYHVIGNYLPYVRATPDLCTCVTVDNLGYVYVLRRLK